MYMKVMQMTLKEMKNKVLKLIEEISSNSVSLTDDPDIAAKINDVINQIQNEVARIKKIPATETIEVEEDDEMLITDIVEDIYQINIIRGVKHEIIGNSVIFKEKGAAKIYYYKYPKQITSETSDDYKFEQTSDVLEIMPYGIAGDLLKSDVSNNYGQIYSNRYESMLQRLDPRYSTGSFYISGDDYGI